ncbi:jg7554 [Pararge aegeria aegeria]|uniref:Jg7554 protein n=1 Tax=Pararge aegeria aegeria TaxID=348720 RepID=A0A8S4S3E4_9NEOP|nr:jg7554 [Pararge aegeria aegeria]
MINDLPKVVQNAKCLLFADDLKLSLTVGDKTYCARLQKDVERVLRWSRDNHLQFNNSKCAVISFSRSHTPFLFDYKFNGKPISRVVEVRDLGVNFNTGLTFRSHIMKCCKKAYRNLGFMLRAVRGFNNMKAVAALYNALVRSQLEANAVIWAPNETKYSHMLERVQNKFIRYLYLRMYGVYPFYPLMYPTLFVLGMVGYKELRARREFTLVAYIVEVMRGRTHNPDVLMQVRLCVPEGYVRRRRRPTLLDWADTFIKRGTNDARPPHPQCHIRAM